MIRIPVVLDVVNRRTPGVARNRSGRRHEIIRVATRLFAEDGYDATPMRAIARELDIDAATLYHYFGSKEDILFDLVRKLEAERLRAALSVPDEGDALERIAAFCLLHFSILVERFDAMTIAQRDRRRLPERRRAILDAARERHVARFRGLIEAAQSAGLVRGDVDPALCATGLLGMSYSLAAAARGADAAGVAGAADAFVSLVLSALRAG